MPTSDDVIDHYDRDRPIDRIRERLVAVGHDLEQLEPHDVAGVDEFHLGGRAATVELMRSIPLSTSSRVLDVGCGIGGAARTIAATAGCHVTGVDLTPSFVDTASELSALVGLGSRTTFGVADALLLPFSDREFDAITMIHVGMNIADKEPLFTELARVLRVGGSLHVYDIMRMGDGAIDFPVPWSSNEATSFVESPTAYRSALGAAGLTVDDPVDRTDLAMEALRSAQANPPSVNLAHLMGPDWPVMFGNLRQCLERGVLAPVEIVARRSTAVAAA